MRATPLLGGKKKIQKGPKKAKNCKKVSKHSPNHPDTNVTVEGPVHKSVFVKSQFSADTGDAVQFLCAGTWKTSIATSFSAAAFPYCIVAKKTAS